MPPTKCHKCGSTDVISWMDAKKAVCPNCCDDHDYQYDRFERTYMCNHCGVNPPNDWYDVDDWD